MFGFNNPKALNPDYGKRQQSISEAVEADLQQIVKNDLPSHRDFVKANISHQMKWIEKAQEKKLANSERIKKAQDEIAYLTAQNAIVDGHIEAARRSIAMMEQL